MPRTVYRGKTELGFQSLAYLREGESSKCVERELEELQHIARESGGEAGSSWSCKNLQFWVCVTDLLWWFVHCHVMRSDLCVS